MMPKKSFTTRLDPEVLALAQQLAQAERRSITSIIEVALIEYAKRKGFRLSDSEGQAEPGQGSAIDGRD